MTIYPAVDILNNRSVRLLYGDRNKVTDYGTPLDMALRFEAEGAKILHIVDLNGAFDSDNTNAKTLQTLVKSIKIPVQLGGGIKTAERAKYAIEELGASYVVMGTAAALNPEILAEACALFPGKIVAGIDVQDGFAAVKGWVEKSALTALELAETVKKSGVSRIVFTDISRDGALSGANVTLTAELQTKSGMEIIASGGVSNLEDIKKLKEKGLFGAILGRALYTGDINLREALKI